MSTNLEQVLARIDADLDQSIARLADLLRIPSVSTDSAYDADVNRAAQWCADQLADIGFDAAVRETTGHPMVVAHYRSDQKPTPFSRDAQRSVPSAPTIPTILYYGHYDVQPPDPLELWDSPPFEPAIVDSTNPGAGAGGKKIVARGAVDDKGQLMTFIEAMRAWKAVHGNLPINITILLEGEEESGSPSLDPFLEQNRDELAADVCIVCDTGMWNINTPAITYMLRGLVYLEATLHGPSHDLHSGMYGGSLINPINALTQILAQLHDNDGKIQIPNFYDDVLPLGEAERKQWENLGFDETEFLQGAGVTQPFGEAGCSTLQRIWARPTCDINGIIGGYTGKGAKTVIASSATVKLSCRLVANQDPRKIYQSLIKFFEDRTPPGCTWEFKNLGASPAIRVPTDSPYLAAAKRGLAAVYNKQPVLIGCGGSIPVVGSIQNILGFDSLLVGFGLDDDNSHSPNEKFELRCFEMGIKSHASIMDQLSAP